MPAARSILLPGGRKALAVLAPANVSGEEAVAALALPRARGVIVLNGGTAELPADLSAALQRSLGDGIARVAVEERLTVVTGGTDAGIFSLFGQVLNDARTAPCIGVAPSGRVTWPGRAPRTRGTPGDVELVPLEPHHSHFILVAGDEWGVETEAMLALSEALSVDRASLAVLAGGGTWARREVLGHVRAGREVIVLAGTGRFADELAGVIAGGRATVLETAEIAATGLVTVTDGADRDSELGELVRARLEVGEKRARR
jgi:SLOG in TRPM, prokaryote